MCAHENIRQATSSDMQDICLDCGAVLRDFAEIEISFQTRPTAHGCTVTMKTPRRTQVKRFRNGYANSQTSANCWINDQIAAYQEFEESRGGRRCAFLVDGKRQ